MKYYYLVASLPELVLGDPSPFTLDDFRFRCATVMEAGDLAELDRVIAGRIEEGATAFCRSWRNADTQLRDAVARVRAGRANVDPRPYLREHTGYSVSMEKAVTDAYAKADPLQRELALDRLRWQRLDEIAWEDRFGLTPVLAFVVKLQIIRRWAGMNEEEGRAKVEELVSGSVKEKMAGI